MTNFVEIFPDMQKVPLNSDLNFKIDWDDVNYATITSNSYTCTQDCCVIVTFSWTVNSGYYKTITITVGDYTYTQKVYNVGGTKTIKYACKKGDVVKIVHQVYATYELTGTVGVQNGYVLY